MGDDAQQPPFYPSVAVAWAPKGDSDGNGAGGALSLRLRPWRPQDADDVARHANDRDVWLQCSDRFAHPFTRADAERWIEFCRAAPTGVGGAPSQMAIVLARRRRRQQQQQQQEQQHGDNDGHEKDHGGGDGGNEDEEDEEEQEEEVIGGIGVSARGDVQRRTLELGFWLGRAHWGRGVGSAAATAFLRHAWQRFPDAERIEALVYAWNARSCGMLERRLGFAREGTLRRAAFKDGRFVDTVVFGLLRDDPQP